MTGLKLGQAVMRALGITGEVRRITIDMGVEGAAIVTVERYAGKVEGDAVVTEISRYDLVERVEEGR